MTRKKMLKKFVGNIHDLNSATLKCNIYFSANDKPSFISSEVETAMDIEVQYIDNHKKVTQLIPFRVFQENEIQNFKNKHS